MKYAITLLFSVFCFISVPAQEFRLLGNAGIQALVGEGTSSTGLVAVSLDYFTYDFRMSVRMSTGASYDTVRSNHLSYIQNPEAQPFNASVGFDYRAPTGPFRPIIYAGAAFGGGAQFGYAADDPTSTGAFSTFNLLAEVGLGITIDSLGDYRNNFRFGVGFSYRRIGGELGTTSNAPVIPDRLVDPATMRAYIFRGATVRTELHGIDLTLDLSLLDKLRLFGRLTAYNDTDYKTVGGTVGLSLLTSFLN